MNSQYAHIPFHRQIRLDFPGESYDSCQVKDLSLSGMSVLGTFHHQVGDTCFVILDQIGTSSRLNLMAFAKVVRKNFDGITIEFTSMSFDSYMFLQMTLLYETGDPLVIEFELSENCPFEITSVPAPVQENRYLFQEF